MADAINIQVKKVANGGKSLLLEADNGAKYFLNVNNVNYHLEIPYTKADGTHMSLEMIRESKQNAAKKLELAKASQSA